MIHSFPPGGTHAKWVFALTEGGIKLHVSETAQNHFKNHVSIRLWSYSIVESKLVAMGSSMFLRANERYALCRKFTVICLGI